MRGDSNESFSLSLNLCSVPGELLPDSKNQKRTSQQGSLQESSHHEMFYLYAEGERTYVRTRLSHGAREYGDNLLSAVAKEMHLRRRELDAFIECPLERTAYVRLLVERGVLRPHHLPEARQ